MGYPSFLEDLEKIRERLETGHTKPFIPTEKAFEAQERRIERERERINRLYEDLLNFVQALEMNLSLVESSELRDLLELQRDTRKRNLLLESIRSKQSEHRRFSQEIAEMQARLAIFEQIKEKKLLQMFQSVAETVRPDVVRDSIKDFFNLRLEEIVSQHPLTQKLRRQIKDEKARTLEARRQSERTISDLRKQLAQAKRKGNIRSL